ncbi:Uncharacterised protein [Paenibacillus macerans]|uniref:Uncharacterized protein n=1 Tax=Paenibacillus macerans TaxID=44252 RepID=A0A090YI06_PAEMA|nr:hypothetical protein DJ90_4298 [Paenibacillus macerans]SUA84538.1 Uncharacterised protein [Paenibacillus macerans]
MKTTLEALVNKDEQAFRSIYYTKPSETILEDYLERYYYFESMEGITKDHNRLNCSSQNKSQN